MFGAVVKHIIGKEHCKKVAQVLQNNEGGAYSQQQFNKHESAVVENEADETLYEGTLVQDLADGGENCIVKRKAHKKKAKSPRDVENSQNVLAAEGVLVVNGLDIVKYIRGLEGRISELERRLEASNNNSVADI